MGPLPLALGLMVNQELSRRLATETLVEQHGIVSPQPVGQVPVKGGQVVKQQPLMEIHEPFLEGTIELFGMSIRIRGH